MIAGTNSGFSHRSDIDGLRGIAVLSVLGYHAFPATLPGGYTGVDVFFVLSGFLVGGAVMRAGPAFDWRTYAIARLSRLWVVLVPALLLTAALDQLAPRLD